jgi:Ca2+-transporting ATPase
MAAACIGVLMVGHYAQNYEWETVRTMVFTALVLTQLGYAYVIRRTSRSSGHHRRNRLLFGAVAASILLQIAVVYLPIGQKLFETVDLPLAAWAPILACVAVGAALVTASDRLSQRA